MAETQDVAAGLPAAGGGGQRAAAAGEQVELLGFMLSDEEYALDILEVREIVRLQPITPVPRSPAWVKGIVTLRGVIVPVFDLRTRLGLAEIPHGPETRIVVVLRAGEPAGLIVDGITQVMRAPLAALEPPPQTIGQVEAEFLRGVARVNDRLVILLNLARVLEVAP